TTLNILTLEWNVLEPKLMLWNIHLNLILVEGNQENTRGHQSSMAFHKSCSVTSEKGDTYDALFCASGEGPAAIIMVDYSSKGNSLLPSVQAPSQLSNMQNCTISTGMDLPLSLRYSVLDASDTDNQQSPRILSLDACLVKKFDLLLPISSLPKFNSFFLPTQQNHTEPQAQAPEIEQNYDTINSFNGINLHHKCFGSIHISHGEEENQMKNQLCHSGQSSQQIIDNCFHINEIKQDSNNDKHNEVSTDAQCPKKEQLKVEKLKMHNQSACLSKAFWDGEHNLSAGNCQEWKNLYSESSAAIATASKENASQSKSFPSSVYAFEDQTSSLGSAGSDIQLAITKYLMEKPLQRHGLKNVMAGNDFVCNLQPSLSGVSRNGQRNTPSKMCGELTNGSFSLKRGLPILIQDTELQKKRQRVEEDSQESLTIPKGKSKREDPRLRSGLAAANAVLDILYPQILFLLNCFVQVDQGSERKEDVNKLLDLELQALAVEQKLPDHITTALLSTASPNSFTFSSDLPLIRHNYHDLLTQLQGVESRACNNIKEAITRFNFLYSNASEAHHLKLRCLKALCHQHREMVLKSFRDNVLLQYCKEIDPVYVLNSLNTEMPELSSITGQNQNFQVDQISSKTLDECKPQDASICNSVASTSIGLSNWTTNENIDLWSNTSRRKRLPKEACTFMDKYLLTNSGRIKREEKEAIARLLKLTFKQ
ncbi:hypothetical protein KI387_014066, partial [Taxus chinensis]